MQYYKDQNIDKNNVNYLNMSTIILLFINGENNTAWRIRLDILRNNFI